MAYHKGEWLEIEGPDKDGDYKIGMECYCGSTVTGYLEPKDFRFLDERHASEQEESPADSPASPVQQLKAEIASLCDVMEGACCPDHYGMHIEAFLSKLRQLSSV